MKKGFTLVELLAVLVILSLIALISIPAISKIIKRQEKNTFNINVESIVKVAKSDWYTYDLTTGYYKYSNGVLSYYASSTATAREVSTDGTMLDGEGVIYIGTGDAFRYAFHDTDWCKLSDDGKEGTITSYSGSCIISE